MSPEQLADAIRQEQQFAREATAIISNAYNCGVDHLINAGVLLNHAKKTVQHGEWGNWLKENFTFTQSTANHWMQMASNPDEVTQLRKEGIVTVKALLKALATPRLKESNSYPVTNLNCEPPQTPQNRTSDQSDFYGERNNGSPDHAGATRQTDRAQESDFRYSFGCPGCGRPGLTRLSSSPSGPYYDYCENCEYSGPLEPELHAGEVSSDASGGPPPSPGSNSGEGPVANTDAPPARASAPLSGPSFLTTPSTHEDQQTPPNGTAAAGTQTQDVQAQPTSQQVGGKPVQNPRHSSTSTASGSNGSPRAPKITPFKHQETIDQIDDVLARAHASFNLFKINTKKTKKEAVFFSDVITLLETLRRGVLTSNDLRAAPPSLDRVFALAAELGLTKEDTERYHDTRTRSGWHYGTPAVNPVRDLKADFRSYIRLVKGGEALNEKRYQKTKTEREESRPGPVIKTVHEVLFEKGMLDPSDPLYDQVASLYQ